MGAGKGMHGRRQECNASAHVLKALTGLQGTGHVRTAGL